jgi:hypothetical protein
MACYDLELALTPLSKFAHLGHLVLSKNPTDAATDRSEGPMNCASDRLTAMPSTSHPLQFVLVALAGWFSQQQRDVIDYLHEENRVLREQIGARRLRFTDDQRRRLAAKPGHSDDGCCASSPRS